MAELLKSQVLEAEENLKAAILSSDVAALDLLLSPSLIFTNHLGQIMSKTDDINAHQSGLLDVEAIDTSEQQIQMVGGVAIVTVKTHIVGSYAGNRSASDLRFSRVWVPAPSSTNALQVVAAHSCIIVQ